MNVQDLAGVALAIMETGSAPASEEGLVHVQQARLLLQCIARGDFIVVQASPQVPVNCGTPVPPGAEP